MASADAKPRCDTADMTTIDLHRADSLTSETSDHFRSRDRCPDIRTIRLRLAGYARTALYEMRDMKIEVVMFVYMFSYILRQLSSTTLVMDKVCLVHLGYSAHTCANLKDFPDEKLKVETMANNYNLAHSLIHGIPAAIVSVFIGSWSDRYSRKVPMIVALVGIILDGLGTIVCAMVFYSRVEFYLIPACFTGFSGGFILVLTVLYSYAADTTPVERRTTKYAIMEVLFGISIPLGQAAGGAIFKVSGYVPLFMLSCFGHIFSLGWIMFVLKETKGLDNTEDWPTKLRKLISIQPFLESYRATMKVRPNKGRQQIFLMILAMSIAYFNVAAAAYIGYPYVHHVFDWDNPTFANVTAIYSVLGMVAMMIAVAISKYLKLDDPIMGIVGTVSTMIRNILIGASPKKEMYHIANLTGLLSSLTTLAGRSRVSKVASKEDIGKVFSFMTVAEMMLPIIASASMIQLFNATVKSFPGLTYLIVGGFLIVPLAVFIWMARLPKVSYSEMQNEEENADELSNNKKF